MVKGEPSNQKGGGWAPGSSWGGKWAATVTNKKKKRSPDRGGTAIGVGVDNMISP